jgi:PAS domain S-box-containing protein
MKTYNIKYEELSSLEEFLKNIEVSTGQSVLVQIFTGVDDEKLLRSISVTIKSAFAQAVIVGASTAGEILNGKMVDESIVLSFCVFDSVSLVSCSFQGDDAYLLGQQVAETILRDDTKAIIMFADGLRCNGEALLRGFSGIADKGIIIAGGLAGDNNVFKKTFIIHNHEILQNAVVAVSLSSKSLLVHNSYNLSWKAIGIPMRITKAVGNSIHEIDNKPIKKIYRDYLGDDIVQNLPDSAIEFPLIFNYKSVQIARSVIAVDGENIIYAGEIPVGTQVRFGVASASVFENGRKILYDSNAKLPIEAIFTYSCTARKSFLAKELEYELLPLETIAPTSGFFTYGEFYSGENNYELLNITTTVLGLSETDKIKHTKNDAILQTKRVSLSTTALIHLVEKTMSNLEQESQAKENTIAQLNQYHAAINNSYIISKSDPQGRITFANEHFCKISGYSLEELLGKNHNIVQHPDMPKEVFKELWQTITSKKIWHGILQNRSKNGQSYYVDATIFPLLDKDKNIISYVGIRDDITEIKNQKYRAEAILNAQDSIVLLTSFVDTKMQVKQLNQKFFEIFDFKNIDDFLLQYSCVCDLFVQKDGYVFKTMQDKSWLEFLLDNQDKAHLVLMLDKNKKERIFSLKAKEINLETEILVISTFTDVTELENARVEALSAEKAKSAFLATMSHELRTPLNSVIGFSQILMKKENMPFESTKSFIEKINISGKYLLNIVNNILDFSKIESGKMQLHTKEFFLKNLIKESCVLMEDEAAKKTIALMQDDFGEVNAVADEQLLKQVILNILSNAIKFSPKNSSIHISYHEDAKNHIITICDHGVGLSKEQLLSVFQPFAQIKEHQNEAIKGTGLGLAISKKIVELHHGKIEATSEVGVGSCFHLHLPKQKDTK